MKTKDLLSYFPLELCAKLLFQEDAFVGGHEEEIKSGKRELTGEDVKKFATASKTIAAEVSLESEPNYVVIIKRLEELVGFKFSDIAWGPTDRVIKEYAEEEAKEMAGTVINQWVQALMYGCDEMVGPKMYLDEHLIPICVLQPFGDSLKDIVMMSLAYYRLSRESTNKVLGQFSQNIKDEIDKSNDGIEIEVGGLEKRYCLKKDEQGYYLT